MMKIDAFVAGGGPAGGLTAWMLARAGFSVLLCEAHAELPERVCGAYLCPAGVALLHSLGLAQATAADARKLRGMVMVAPNHRRLEALFPSDGALPDHGLALHRPEFDRRLLELAAQEGAIVWMGARLIKARREETGANGGWELTLDNGERLHTRLLIGADGRKSTVAKLLGLSLPAKRCRAAVHIDLPSACPTTPLGQMHVFADGSYIGLNPLAPDKINVSLVCDPEVLRGSKPVALLNRKIESSPHLGQLLAPMPEDARTGATFPATARVSAPTAPGAALVGDASGFIDPLTGEGIYNALWTAVELSQAVRRHWSDLPAALAHYSKIRRSRQRGKALLSHVFQGCISRPKVANAILASLAWRQSVANAFIGIVGNSYSPSNGIMRMLRHAILS